MVEGSPKLYITTEVRAIPAYQSVRECGNSLKGIHCRPAGVGSIIIIIKYLHCRPRRVGSGFVALNWYFQTDW